MDIEMNEIGHRIEGLPNEEVEQIEVTCFPVGSPHQPFGIHTTNM